VPNELRGAAYADRPLPIGYGPHHERRYRAAQAFPLLRIRPRQYEVVGKAANTLQRSYGVFPSLFRRLTEARRI